MTWSFKKDGTEVNSGTGLLATYDVPSVVLADAGAYTCVFTNDAGESTTNAATVTVNSAAKPPTVSEHPSDVNITEGDTLTLNASATGDTPMSWSFQQDSVEVLAGSGLAATYNKPNALLADAGNYTCTFTNNAGSVTTNTAVVTIAPVPITVTTVKVINDSGTNTLNPNTSIDLHAVVTYSDDTTISSLDEPEIVTWSSSTPNVALVDSNGNTTPVGIGDATITATARDLDANDESLTDSVLINMAFVEGQYFTVDLGTNNDGRGDDSNIGFNNAVMGAVVTGTFQQDIPLIKAYWNNPNYTYFGTYAVFESGTGDKFYGLDALVWRWEFSDGYTIDYDLIWNGSSYIINSEVLFSVWDSLLTRKEQTGVNVHILNAPTVAPTISLDLDPALEVTEGTAFVLNAEASGGDPMRWQLRDGNITIADGVGKQAQYRVEVATADETGFYKFIFSNAAGNTETVVCAVTVSDPVAPTIEQQPTDMTTDEGLPISLTATASGTQPMTWEAFKDGAPVSSGTGLTAVISKDQAEFFDGGEYYFAFSNSVGRTDTQSATIQVTLTFPDTPAFIVTIGEYTGAGFVRYGLRNQPDDEANNFGALVSSDGNQFGSEIISFYFSDRIEYPMVFKDLNEGMWGSEPSLLYKLVFLDGTQAYSRGSLVTYEGTGEVFYLNGLVNEAINGLMAARVGENVDVYVMPPTVDYATFDTDFEITVGVDSGSEYYGFGGSMGAITPASDNWQPNTLDDVSQFWWTTGGYYNHCFLSNDTNTRWNDFEPPIRVEMISEQGKYTIEVMDAYAVDSPIYGYYAREKNHEMRSLFIDEIGTKYKVRISKA